MPVIYKTADAKEFPVHLPVGFQRPINPDNFFGVSRLQWLRGRVVVPVRPVSLFGPLYFEPYAESVIYALGRSKPKARKVQLAITEEPSRYVFIYEDTKESIPFLWRAESVVPPPRLFTVEDVCAVIERVGNPWHDQTVFTFIEMIKEDIPCTRWMSLVARFPWINDVLR